MNLYLFMGTHLPEVRHCFDRLAREAILEEPLTVYLPNGLAWEDAPYTIETYEPEAAAWVFNPDAEGSAFILVDPRHSPVPQLEKMASDLRKCLLEPVKICTCVDCQAAENEPRLQKFYDACLYYSDIVLLGHRGGASKRFLRDYQKAFERKCYPCVFLLLKGAGEPSDALEILTPGTRRLSQMFDLPEAGPPEAATGMVIEASCDLDLEEEESDPFRTPDEAEGSVTPVPDASPWIVRPDEKTA